MSTKPISTTTTVTPPTTETGVNNLKPSPQKTTHVPSFSMFHKLDGLAQSVEDEKAQTIQQNFFAFPIPNLFRPSSIVPLHGKVSLFKQESVLAESTPTETSEPKLTPAKRPLPYTEPTNSDADDNSSRSSSSFKKPKLETPNPFHSCFHPGTEGEVSSIADSGEFAAVYLQPTASNPPPTPRKGKSATAREKIVSEYETRIARAEAKEPQNIRGVNVSLQLIAYGTFMNCYSIQQADGNVVPGVPNSQVLIKLYHGKKTQFTPKLYQHMQNSIENYHAAQKIQIPVAAIYNSTTASQDHCLIVERIPHEDGVQGKGDIDLTNEHHVEQVCDRFKKSFENQIPLDLSFSNLRVRDDGTVTLVDFVENPDDFYKAGKKREFVVRFLKSWCRQIQNILYKNDSTCPAEIAKEESRKLLERLTQGLGQHGFDPSWNQEALDDTFIRVVNEYHI